MVRCILAAVVCCFALASGLCVGGRRGLWCNFARRPKRSPCARDVGGLTMAAPKHSTPYVRSAQVYEGKLAAVVAEITDVAESVKHVQEEIDEVGVEIEDIKTKLEQPNLSVRKEDLLAVEFKSLLDKEAALRCEKQSLLDKESHQDGPVLQWGAERVVLAPDPVNWESIKLGDVVTVPMGHSGLNDDEPSSSQKLYVRRACLDLYKFLSESSENMLLVTGCPGVGKSVEVYSFALEQAQLRKKRVLYVHGDSESGLSVVFFDDPTVATALVARQTFSKEPAALDAFVDGVLRDGLVDLIILDGSLSWLILNVFLKMRRFPNAKLVTCTSFQAPGKMSQEASMKCAPRKRFVMDSWREEELYAALDAGAISLSPGTARSEMFFYAGGSIRLFLAPVEQVITELQSKIQAAPDMGKLVGSGGVGDSSADATNSLMAIYDGKSVVISKYVMRVLMDSVSDEFIQKALRFLPDNPSWLGTLFEGALMRLAGTQSSVTLLTDSNLSSSVETWRGDAARVTKFKDTAELKLQAASAGSEECGWFQPTKWNQEGYDAIFRASSDKLRIIQISTGVKSRKFDLELAIPLAQAMNTQEIEIVLICGPKTFGKVGISESGGIASRRALEAALKDIENAKKASRAKPAQAASITFRTLCYHLK